ncbi:MAG: lipocalin family protein [Phenylobacterium sp.]|uniref:lipocalin family protein n=1 Tax=Phenylobacterium sp. TaxID=1871053 RepID=UPI0039195417
MRKLIIPLVLAAGAGLALAACATPPVGNRAVPQPAKAVDLPRYLGKWYEFARYDHRFERNCEGVTAEYALRDDGLIKVTNTCRKGGPAGAVEVAEGKAKVVEGSRNAKLKVSFFGPFYVGDYWVLDHADDYSWSIVGEGSGRYLWILTREPVPSPEEARALVDRAAGLGYDTELLHMTEQPPA